MTTSSSGDTWRVRLVRSNLPWGSRPDRPAEVGDELCRSLLAKENIVEDANYQKIVPNEFIVEIGGVNYARNYQPLKDQILRQWNEKLLAYLLTANSRQGRQEYRFAGPLSIEIRPAADLDASQARISSRVQARDELVPPSTAQVDLTACLELLPGLRRWNLRSGMMTIGRDSSCDVFLDHPEVQQKKLVSSQHAYLVCTAGGVRLYDGATDGTPSLNGTYVNLHPVPRGGVELKNGDVILLAALDARRPNPAAPGVAQLRFLTEC